jgi:hypothetical protein
LTTSTGSSSGSEGVHVVDGMLIDSQGSIVGAVD